MKYLIIIILTIVVTSAIAFTEIWQPIRDCEPVAKNQFLKEPLKIDLNSADLKTLLKLKGIGPKKAQAIIDYRTSNGSLSSNADLLKIKGFSKKIVAKLVKDNEPILVVGS